MEGVGIDDTILHCILYLLGNYLMTEHRYCSSLFLINDDSIDYENADDDENAEQIMIKIDI
jgi:hypothetical protein